jgi:asparagine synthase (glutamine-hydrolysing)
MSGIVAIVHGDGRPVERLRLRRMLQAIRHRGPDGLTLWTDGPVGFGHGLMHTTPESLMERQPVSDGSCWLVWDGRLDNRQELLVSLRATGFSCGTETDPETVLGAYRAWGEESAAKLLGDFAFVIWDARTRSLFGARDRLGLKPLYYTQQGSTLFIASEAKALLSALDRTPEPDDELVLAMLLSECREPDNTRSLFTGIHRLPPGHVLRMRDGRIETSRYWQIDPARQTLYRRPEEYVEHFGALFREAVACRTRSAYPVGCTLSGGLDSSSITAMAAATAGSSVEAFTIFSDDPESDERRYARQVAATAGIPLWEFHDRGHNPLEGLEELLWKVECPLVSTMSDIPGFSRLVRSRHCRILLDGEGGDHLLDEEGYLSDLALKTPPARFLRETRNFADWYGAPARQFASTAVNSVLPVSLKALGKHVLRRVPPDWINRALAKRVGLASRVRTPRSPLTFPSFAQAITYENVCSPYFLLKLELIEREAAYAGREFWYPFLDSRLLEFVLSIPWTQRCHEGQRKWLLRQATAELLPEPIRARQGKGDVTNQMDRALADLCRSTPPEPLADRSGMLARYVDLQGAQTLVRRYLGGTRRTRWQVWSLVTLDRWLKRAWKEGGHADAGIEILGQEAVHAAEVTLVR